MKRASRELLWRRRAGSRGRPVAAGRDAFPGRRTRGFRSIEVLPGGGVAGRASGGPAPDGLISPGKPNSILHEGIMAFIKTISAREADAELREIYGMIRSDTVGPFPLPVEWTTWNVMRVFSLRPQFLWAFGRG